ncbi:MAG: hypothetical protein A2X18_01445 [Bacteroidetes bacterium GWF2_40_14]|nr:MAG: hypothetical protein A2X18_01445 [Bacteroidetes bacterium GWF2_40_14]
MWQFFYWTIAALLLFFVFSNRSYDLEIRWMVVLTISIMSFCLSYFINNFLIPEYLFEGKYFRFVYLMLSAFIISVWINYLSFIYILWITSRDSSDVVYPGQQDVLLLMSGGYIIILFAAFIHFIKESYKRQIERDKIAKQKIETELKLKDAKLKLLQNQLHPHFLFNMLNNIYGLWMENSKSTPDIILKLSGLLDFILYECDKEKILLEKEIYFIRDYTDLEILRHDKRLTVDIILPDNNHNLILSPLLLFTFIENAFKHGADKNIGESHISVRIEIYLKTIQLSVCNNYTPDATTNNQSGKGIGLNNVRERLNLLYPGKHQLKIDDNNGSYKVELSVETD